MADEPLPWTPHPWARRKWESEKVKETKIVNEKLKIKKHSRVLARLRFQLPLSTYLIFIANANLKLQTIGTRCSIQEHATAKSELFKSKFKIFIQSSLDRSPRSVAQSLYMARKRKYTTMDHRDGAASPIPFWIIMCP